MDDLEVPPFQEAFMLPVGKSCWLLSFGGTKKIRGAPKLPKDRLCPAAGQRTH